MTFVNDHSRMTWLFFFYKIDMSDSQYFRFSIVKLKLNLDEKLVFFNLIMSMNMNVIL